MMMHSTLRSFFLLMLLCSGWAVAAPKLGDTDFPRPSPSSRHTKKIAAAKNGNYDLVLIGDSITHTVGELGGKYEPMKEVWKKHFASRNAINLGYNGYRTEQILWNLQNGELDFASSPKVAMILIGTNNSDDRHFKKVHTAEEIFAGTKAIVDLVKERHPTTKILVLRIFPRGGDGEKGVSPPAFNSSKQCIETCRRAWGAHQETGRRQAGLLARCKPRFPAQGWDHQYGLDVGLTPSQSGRCGSLGAGRNADP